MTNQQPTKRPEPGNGPFDDPAMSIGAQSTAVFIGAVDSIAAIRTRQDHPARGELRPERVAVVAAVPNQVSGVAPVRRHAGVERRGDESNFRRRRRGDGDSQRKTLTLDQYHAL